MKLSIKPDIEFKKVLETLDDLRLPDTETKPQNIKYAVLEMINNSLRAHRENRIPDPLSVTFEHSVPQLTIEIRDRGPGFNPDKLPYSLTDDPDSVDMKSEAFNRYREKNNYLRFGMGLHVVRKTFSSFELMFLDKEGLSIPWSEGKVRGTLIKVKIEAKNNGT